LGHLEPERDNLGTVTSQLHSRALIAVSLARAPGDLSGTSVAEPRDMGPNPRLLVLLLAVVGASVVGCATPAPLVRLDPISDQVFWVSGRPSVQLEERGVRVAAAFDRQVGPLLGVRVEIENGTDRKLEVDPGQEFSFMTCKAATETSCAKELLVVDPEDMIDHFDQAASREQADAINDERASGALLLLGAASDTAALASRNGRSAPLDTEGAAAEMHNQAADHDRALPAIAAQREMWSDVALRHSTLLPGASVGGQVFIPADGGSQNVLLRIRVGNRTFPFHFRQVARQVPRNG
jgi:hypothetical protein